MLSQEFSYNVKISESSAIFDENFLGGCFPLITEMVITSKPFQKYDDCANALTNLLALIATMNTQITERNHVIVTKANPILTDPPGKAIPEERWDTNTLMRAFVADADLLKSNKLKFDIMGQITLTSRTSSQSEITQ